MSVSAISDCLPYSRDAVRVRVKKCSGDTPPDCRKFSIDPQITSFEVLQSIIAKAFDIKGDFTLSYRAIDDYGQDTLLPLLSDWDLDAAVVSFSEPWLYINIDAKHSEDKAWIQPERTMDQKPRDVFGTIEIPRSQVAASKPQTRLPGLIMERTLNMFQRAFNLGEEVNTPAPIPPRPPLSDTEFRKFLDPVGQVSHMKELRSTIYFCGIEPSLRKVVWKHLLNVYPHGMTGRERMDYMKKKTVQYEQLKEAWRTCLQGNVINDELAYVTSMVRKDVLRTDRHHKFYAGNDDNQNVASLFNILTTYALNHPSVSYCQGMSDLASPLLVTMGEEAHAYVCFCALMERMKPNFMLDGATMTLKFQHLTEGLLQCDPEFYKYLKLHQADDLLFCYRWLLLEMKREFAFDDALHMLEVLWSSLEANPPVEELPLFEVEFSVHASSGATPPVSPLVRTPRDTPYTKVCALRRQTSSMSLTSLPSSRRVKTTRQNQSLDESSFARQNKFRKQGHMKPFLSLDDNCVDMLGDNIRTDIDPLALMRKHLSSLKVMNRRNNTLSSSTGNLNETGSSGGGKRGGARKPGQEQSSLSLNKLPSEKENDDSKVGKVHKGKTVKNLNEFLNLAGRTGRSLRPRQRSQCSSISESDVLDGPSITITRSGNVCVDPEGNSDEDSDRSSLKHTSSFSSSISPNVFDASHESSPDAPPSRLAPESPDEPHPRFAPESPDEVRLQESDSSPDNSADYCPVTTSMTRELRLELASLDRQVLGMQSQKPGPSSTEPEVFIWENPMQLPTTPDEQIDLELDDVKLDDALHNGVSSASSEQVSEVPTFLARSALTTSSILHSLRTGQIMKSAIPSFCDLPGPEQFGGGNPFLMFLCLTLLRQHRDFIMKNQMDYNEMAMHFDKMVRKHNVTRVLAEARQLFAAYIKQQQAAQNSKQNFKV